MIAATSLAYIATLGLPFPEALERFVGVNAFDRDARTIDVPNDDDDRFVVAFKSTFNDDDDDDDDVRTWHMPNVDADTGVARSLRMIYI